MIRSSGDKAERARTPDCRNRQSRKPVAIRGAVRTSPQLADNPPSQHAPQSIRSKRKTGSHHHRADGVNQRAADPGALTDAMPRAKALLADPEIAKNIRRKSVCASASTAHIACRQKSQRQKQWHRLRKQLWKQRHRHPRGQNMPSGVANAASVMEPDRARTAERSKREMENSPSGPAPHTAPRSPASWEAVRSSTAVERKRIIGRLHRRPLLARKTPSITTNTTIGGSCIRPRWSACGPRPRSPTRLCSDHKSSTNDMTKKQRQDPKDPAR